MGQPTAREVHLASVLDARSTVSVKLAARLSAAHTGVDVARIVTHTLGSGGAVEAVDERVQRATENFADPDIDRDVAVDRASAGSVKLLSIIGGSTVAGSAINASTLLAHDVARLGSSAASVHGLTGILVSGAAFAAGRAADGAQEARVGHVAVGGTSGGEHAGDGSASTEDLREATLHVATDKVACLEWLERVFEAERLGDRHKGDDAGDQSNSHS